MISRGAGTIAPSASRSLLSGGGETISLAETTTVATVEVGVGADAPRVQQLYEADWRAASKLESCGGRLCVSVYRALEKNGSPTDDFIVGDILVLPVLAEVILDRDNDGLDDGIEPDPKNPDPGVLGPATAEFAEVTGGAANEVSLSLGNVAPLPGSG